VIALLRTPHLDAGVPAGSRVDWRARPRAQRRSLSRWCGPVVRRGRLMAGCAAGGVNTPGFQRAGGRHGCPGARGS
jgi:hypothetical protein